MLFVTACSIAYFTNLTWFVMLRMSEHGILKYFCPILDEKDPPRDKGLLDPSWPLSKFIPSSSSIASCDAKVTKVLKQAKWSVTKNHYMKLTPAIVGSHTFL